MNETLAFQFDFLFIIEDLPKPARRALSARGVYTCNISTHLKKTVTWVLVELTRVSVSGFFDRTENDFREKEALGTVTLAVISSP